MPAIIVDNTVPQQKFKVSEFSAGEYFKCSDYNHLYLKVSSSGLTDDAQKFVDPRTVALRLQDNRIVHLSDLKPAFYKVQVKLVIESIIQPK
jgi:hypothetical protein